MDWIIWVQIGAVSAGALIGAHISNWYVPDPEPTPLTLAELPEEVQDEIEQNTRWWDREYAKALEACDE
jgi:hypothetical protein